MDHHCPYLNRCVGFKNKKYFTLFLIYIIIYIFFILLTTMHSFIQCWNETFYNYRTEYHIFCMVTISICAIIPVLSVLIYTLRATALNRTSLEQEFVPVEAATNKENTYLFDIGSWKKNFQDIFVKNIILALLPIWSTPNDGCEYNIVRENPMFNNPFFLRYEDLKWPHVFKSISFFANFTFKTYRVVYNLMQSTKNSYIRWITGISVTLIILSFLIYFLTIIQHRIRLSVWHDFQKNFILSPLDYTTYNTRNTINFVQFTQRIENQPPLNRIFVYLHNTVSISILKNLASFKFCNILFLILITVLLQNREKN
jgi:hypothetical protein